MVSRRSPAAVARIETSLYRWRRLQSGQCIRCFHASIRKHEEKTGAPNSKQEQQPIGPRRGPSRQERAAMVSEQVNLIQSEPASPSYVADQQPTQPTASTMEDESASAEIQKTSTPEQSGDAPITRPPSNTSQARSSRPGSRAFEPNSVSREDLLHRGRGVSTISASSIEGVLEDRRKFLHTPEWQDRQPVSRPKTIAVPEATRKRLIERLAAGKYDTDGLLEGKQKHKHPVLNEVAKMVMLNGTYMAQDGDRFARKVQSLLPSAGAAARQRVASKPTAETLR